MSSATPSTTSSIAPSSISAETAKRAIYDALYAKKGQTRKAASKMMDGLLSAPDNKLDDIKLKWTKISTSVYNPESGPPSLQEQRKRWLEHYSTENPDMSLEEKLVLTAFHGSTARERTDNYRMMDKMIQDTVPTDKKSRNIREWWESMKPNPSDEGNRDIVEERNSWYGWTHGSATRSGPGDCVNDDTVEQTEGSASSFARNEHSETVQTSTSPKHESQRSATSGSNSSDTSS
ncbi:uncharacterized protein IL334_006356 [Kwoniella shivajii]|uniref:Uncharacterized protein n=1 Tax=Kwoniella shivajii TaxID=564305 RepID=A0ABZ1D9P0_9TREE|nr:hypothetical protein IL334_006356 [Kwoniella shivajii]